MQKWCTKLHEFINITVQDEAEADGTLETYCTQYTWIAGVNRQNLDVTKIMKVVSLKAPICFDLL